MTFKTKFRLMLAAALLFAVTPAIVQAFKGPSSNGPCAGCHPTHASAEPPNSVAVSCGVTHRPVRGSCGSTCVRPYAHAGACICGNGHAF